MDGGDDFGEFGVGAEEVPGDHGAEAAVGAEDEDSFVFEGFLGGVVVFIGIFNFIALDVFVVVVAAATLFSHLFFHLADLIA